MAVLEFKYSEPKETGRPAYHPADLLKLYLYGYLNRIRSIRRLESETHRNIELIWLMQMLRPDFKTIADFRKDNKKAIKKVCREFTLLCIDCYVPEPQKSQNEQKGVYTNRNFRYDAQSDTSICSTGQSLKNSGYCEHPFGTIKQSFGYRNFLCKGNETVSAEMGFTTLAYNMKRVIHILGVERLLMALI